MSLSGGRTPRDVGNRAERTVAKYMDGQRVVGSGAYKHSNKNLLGDVDVRVNNRDYLKIEVKTTGRTHPSKGMYYTVTSAVLNQMKREAEQYKQLGCLWIHFKGASPSADYVIFPEWHAIQYFQKARLYFMLNAEPIVGKKSKIFYRYSLETLFPISDEVEVGGLQLTMLNTDGNYERYSIVRGGDVRYALTLIHEKEAQHAP